MTPPTPLIIDSHCHVWARWPYQPPVPDADTRATVDQLLFEMDTNGVDQALIVCAEIDHNPDNNAAIYEVVRIHPNRLFQLVDVDSRWKPTCHQPGAANRMRQAVEAWSPKGFTHYLSAHDDGSWLYSADGLDFFSAAASNDLLASLHCYPHQQKAVREVAKRFPELPILIHHLGHLRAGDTAQLDEVLASSECENIYIKISGFYYATQLDHWDFPYRDVLPIVQAIYQHFGARRLCWGSDYPVVRKHMTYRQAIEVFRKYCDFVPLLDQNMILGGTMHRLLNAAVS